MFSGGGGLEEQALDIKANLSGNSGCQLFLCGEKPNYFVRKVSSSKDYNTRLKRQYIKQKYFYLQDVNVPRIIKYGYVEDKFYFDMQYIKCRTFAESVENLSHYQADSMIDFLMEVFPFKSVKYDKTKAELAFGGKINSLLMYSDKNLLYKTALEKLKNFDFSEVPNSYCCGDLTLENILLSNEGNIYLIDFLDSFYNSWMIDAAKLLQDLDLGWSYRNKNEISTNLKIRLLLLKQKFLSRISKLPDGENFCLQIYYILLLNVMRIVPYCKDDSTYNFLQSALEKTLNTIKEMEN